MSKKLVVCVRSVEKAEYHIKESDLIPENDEEKAMTKEDLFLHKLSLYDFDAKHAWYEEHAVEAIVVDSDE